MRANFREYAAGARRPQAKGALAKMRIFSRVLLICCIRLTVQRIVGGTGRAGLRSGTIAAVRRSRKRPLPNGSGMTDQ
jgi:hypothetical protein